MADKTAKEIKLDERNHVEKPLLDQLAGLHWQVIDLDSKQQPSDTFRDSFTEVVMLPILRQQLKVINPWLEDDQIEEVVKQLTASFPTTSLIQNNRHVFNLLLEDTSVNENHKTGAHCRPLGQQGRQSRGLIAGSIERFSCRGMRSVAEGARSGLRGASHSQSCRPIVVPYH